MALVFPRAHYLVVASAFGWLLACVFAGDALRRVGASYRGASPLACVFAAIALALIVPRPGTSTVEPMPMRRTVAALRELRLRPSPIFQLGTGYAAFAGYDYPTLGGWDKNEPLLQLFARAHIGIVILDERSLGRGGFTGDPESAAFLSEPLQHGFCEVYSLPNFVRVFAKPEVLDDSVRQRACDGLSLQEP